MTKTCVQSVEKHTLAALLSSFSQYDLFEELDWQVQEALGSSDLLVILDNVEFELRGDYHRSPVVEDLFFQKEENSLGLSFLGTPSVKIMYSVFGMVRLSLEWLKKHISSSVRRTSIY